MDYLKFTCSTRLFTIFSKMWFPPHLETHRTESTAMELRNAVQYSSVHTVPHCLRAQSPEAISGQRIDLHVVESGQLVDSSLLKRCTCSGWSATMCGHWLEPHYLLVCRIAFVCVFRDLCFVLVGIQYGYLHNCQFIIDH